MTQPVCPNCQSPIREDVAGGLCGVCLMRAALDPGPTQATPATSGSGRFVPPTPEMLASSFPGLEVRSLIGVGGMGAVYLAYQKSLDRLVALKILPAEIASDPLFAERFAREARALAKLNHPNIVTVYEAGQTGPWCFLQMEYVDGITLRQAISDGILSPRASLEVVQQVCLALEYAHEMQIVHRDIKPENVLLDRRGRIKIADFGLAKMLGDRAGDITLTRSHQIMGTFVYMAPEQIEASSSVDHRADLYSLGVMFYELLTGHLPVGRFELPSERANIDPHWDDVVLRALERSPAKRYQQASDFNVDLDRISKSTPQKPASAATPGVPAKAEIAGAVASSTPAEVPTPRRDTDRRYGPPLPFHLGDDGNLGSGIAKITSTHLELEFRVSVSGWIMELGRINPGTYVVGIPWQQIYAFRLEKNWYYTRLRISPDSMQYLNQVPASKNGEIVLGVRRIDRAAADSFCDRIQERLTNAPESPAVNPTFRAISSSQDEVTEPLRKYDIPGLLLLIAAISLMVAAMYKAFDHPAMANFEAPVTLIWLQGTFGLIGAWARLTKASRIIADIGAGIMCVWFADEAIATFFIGLAAILYNRQAINQQFAAAALSQPNFWARLFNLPKLSNFVEMRAMEKRLRASAIAAICGGLGGLWIIGLMSLYVIEVRDTEYPLIYALSAPACIALLVAGGLTIFRQQWDLAMACLLIAVIPAGVPHLLILPFVIGLGITLLTGDSRLAFNSPHLFELTPIKGDELAPTAVHQSPAMQQQLTGIHRPPRVKAGKSASPKGTAENSREGGRGERLIPIVAKFGIFVDLLVIVALGIVLFMWSGVIPDAKLEVELHVVEPLVAWCGQHFQLKDPIVVIRWCILVLLSLHATMIAAILKVTVIRQRDGFSADRTLVASIMSLPLHVGCLLGLPWLALRLILRRG